MRYISHKPSIVDDTTIIIRVDVGYFIEQYREYRGNGTVWHNVVTGERAGTLGEGRLCAWWWLICHGDKPEQLPSTRMRWYNRYVRVWNWWVDHGKWVGLAVLIAACWLAVVLGLA